MVTPRDSAIHGFQHLRARGVRTYRICQRVLMFHHFQDEPGLESNCLVRSTDFTYSDEVNPTDPATPSIPS
jgi:hypothetical protein